MNCSKVEESFLFIKQYCPALLSSIPVCSEQSKSMDLFNKSLTL